MVAFYSVQKMENRFPLLWLKPYFVIAGGTLFSI